MSFFLQITSSVFTKCVYETWYNDDPDDLKNTSSLNHILLYAYECGAEITEKNIAELLYNSLEIKNGFVPYTGFSCFLLNYANEKSIKIPQDFIKKRILNSLDEIDIIYGIIETLIDSAEISGYVIPKNICIDVIKSWDEDVEVLFDKENNLLVKTLSYMKKNGFISLKENVFALKKEEKSEAYNEIIEKYAENFDH